MTDKIAVHVKTQEEYDELMKAYEKKGWEHFGGAYLFGTKKWDYVEFEDSYMMFMETYSRKKYYKIISLKEALNLLNMDKTLVCKENLKIGDVVVDSDGNERTVLEVLEKIFFFSFPNLPELVDEFRSYYSVQKEGWKIKLPESELVEFGGKKYRADEVAERLAELKAIE